VPFNNAQEQGKPIEIKDEGLSLAKNIGSIDFTGSGVTGTALGTDVTESVPGEDLSGLVPYTGATTDVDLGANDITANNLTGTNTGDQDLSGYVPYTGATTDVDLGDNELSADRVGIGTSSSSYALDVNQYDDLHGIILRGYDDQSSNYFETHINTHGNTNMKSIGSVTFDSDSYFQFGQNAATAVKFGSTYRHVNTPFQFYGYNSSAGTFPAAEFLVDSDGIFKLSRSTTDMPSFNVEMPFNVTGGDVGITAGDLDVSGKATIGGTATGQSTIAKGLVVNNGSGNAAEDDFQVKTDTTDKALFIDASEETAEFNVPTKVGDITGGDYTSFDADGTMQANGDATTWDDLRVSPNSLPNLGAQSPKHVVIANDGESGTTGDSIGFDGSTQYATLPDNAEMDAIDNASFSFWTKPTTDSGTFAFRDNYIHFRKSWSDLVISLDDSWEVYCSGVLVDGANHHIVITMEPSGSRTRLKVYVNNVEVENTTLWGYKLAAQTSDMIFGLDDGTDYLTASVDEFHMYNVTLTATQVSELYAAGDGITTVPTGITESTDLVFRFHFDDPNMIDNDSTLGAGHDLTLTGSPTYEDPLITASGTAGSFGVLALEFSATETNQVFFTAQLPHTYVQGSDIEPHVHWQYKTSNSGNVVWGLEYMWVNVGASGAGNTTLLENAMATGSPATHLATNIGIIDGTGKTISSILTCRLYRKGDDVLDTYPDPVYLSEFDFHFQINTMGSRGIWTK